MTVAHAARRIVTCDAARATDGYPLGVIEDGAIVVDGAKISWVGPRRELPPAVHVIDHGEVAITPGLVDAHTHACWVGSRHAEYAVRMAGGDYEAIAQVGGGIVSTHRAVAGATLAYLIRELAARLRRMATLGVTTVEVKSGYGLDAEAERMQLRAIREVAKDPTLPHLVPTFLALHALSPLARTDREGYVRRVAEELVPEVAAAGWAKFVDAYIDREAFQVAEARRVFDAATRAGLGIRAHVGQFSDIGGAELAAEFGAATVDHMEHVGATGMACLAAAHTRAVMLPTASFTLAQVPPPVDALREAGVELVIASDANPGTAPSESLPLALAFAVRSYGIQPREALLAVTRTAAASLGCFGPTCEVARGALLAGAAADFVVWDLPHEIAIVQPWGVSRTRLVVREGQVLHEATASG
jgi:imidazolonepropionase